MDMNRISRVIRTKQTARYLYNRMSRWYDLLAGSSEQKFMKIGISQLNPIPGDNILEIGCGTGHGLIAISRSIAQSGNVTGLDISEGMLSQSITLIRKSVFRNSIRLHLGDGCNLPYPSNFFSAAFLSFTLELFDTPEIPQVLSECSRVLNRHGRIVIVCLDKKDSMPVRLYEWFHKLMPEVVDCRPILVQPFLRQTSFIITDSKIKKMWGLPVEIVTAVIANENKQDQYEK